MQAITAWVALSTTVKVSLHKALQYLTVVQQRGSMELMLSIQQEKYNYGDIK